MRKILFLLCGVLFLVGQLSAQNRTVSGKVTDAAGTAVSNASVIVKGTRVGTTSNANGNFSFSVPANAKALIVSAVGLASIEVSIPASGNVGVTLQQDDKKLEEVLLQVTRLEKKEMRLEQFPPFVERKLKTYQTHLWIKPYKDVLLVCWFNPTVVFRVVVLM
jgi:hypothetical protein